MKLNKVVSYMAMMMVMLVALVCVSPAFATDLPTDVAPTAESLEVMLIVALGASLQSVAMMGLKKVLGMVPKVLIPTLIIPILSVGSVWLASYATSSHFNPVVAAFLTTATVWVRESAHTANEHGLDSIDTVKREDDKKK